jgi:hypothetical protein
VVSLLSLPPPPPPLAVRVVVAGLAIVDGVPFLLGPGVDVFGGYGAPFDTPPLPTVIV